MTPLAPTPFRIAVPETVLTDLRERLARTRFPDQAPGAPWAFGADLAYVKELCAYWRDRYDWRKHEALLNGFRQFTAPVAGIDLHFIHEEGRGPAPAAAPALARLARVGLGVPQDHPDADRPRALRRRPARRLHRGRAVAARLRLLLHAGPAALRHHGDRRRLRDPHDGCPRLPPLRRAGRRLGRLHHLAARRSPTRSGWPASTSTSSRCAATCPARRDPTPEERAYLDDLGAWLREETGYQWIQGTKPQTLAFGLTDSPAGLAAWIVEKFRSWSDCGGDVERRFTKDELLTNITLYWVTGAINSSFWPYYARFHSPWPIADGQRIEVPTAYAAFPKEIVRPPRSWAERVYNIHRWTVMPSGGHFAALEEPQALVDDLRAFFRDLR